jgi:hypothetical protein
MVLGVTVTLEVALTVIQVAGIVAPTQLLHLEAITLPRVGIVTRVKIHSAAPPVVTGLARWPRVRRWVYPPQRLT